MLKDIVTSTITFILVSGEGEGREEWKGKVQGQGTGVEIKPTRCVSDLSQYGSFCFNTNIVIDTTVVSAQMSYITP